MTEALAISTLHELMLEAFPGLNAHKELIDDISVFSAELVPLRLEDAEAETAALSRFLELQLRLLDVLDDRFVSVLRIARDRQLDSLILGEYGSVQAERKLALRHLQSASEVFGDLVEFLDNMFEALPTEAAFGMIQRIHGSTASNEIVEHPEARLLLQWLIALLVGSEAANTDGVEDVSFWAHRALTASRQVKALLVREARVLQGTRTRMKANLAWANWDDEKIRAEKESWQDL